MRGQRYVLLMDRVAAAAAVTSVVSDSVRPHRWKPTKLPRPWDSPGKDTGVGCHFLLQCMKVKSKSEVTQPCPTLSNPMDCGLPGSSVHGIFQARVLEWVTIAFSKWTELCTTNEAAEIHLWVFGIAVLKEIVCWASTQYLVRRRCNRSSFYIPWICPIFIPYYVTNITIFLHFSITTLLIL